METYPSQQTMILLMMFCFPWGVSGYPGCCKPGFSVGRKYDIVRVDQVDVGARALRTLRSPSYIPRAQAMLSINDYQSSDTPPTSRREIQQAGTGTILEE